MSQNSVIAVKLTTLGLIAYGSIWAYVKLIPQLIGNPQVHLFPLGTLQDIKRLLSSIQSGGDKTEPWHLLLAYTLGYLVKQAFASTFCRC